MNKHLFALLIFTCAHVPAHGTTIQKVAVTPSFTMVTMAHVIPHDLLFSTALLARNQRRPHHPWTCVTAWGDEPLPTMQSDPQGLANLDGRLRLLGYQPTPSATSRLLAVLAARLRPW